MTLDYRLSPKRGGDRTLELGIAVAGPFVLERPAMSLGPQLPVRLDPIYWVKRAYGRRVNGPVRNAIRIRCSTASHQREGHSQTFP